MRHGVEGQHDPRDLVNPCLGGGAFEQASAEHVVERPVASLIDGVAFGMVGGSENPLYPEGAHNLVHISLTNSRPTVGKEPALCAKVRNHMLKEGLTHLVCGMIARRDEDGVLRIAVKKHDEELLAVIGWQMSHNVN